MSAAVDFWCNRTFKDHVALLSPIIKEKLQIFPTESFDASS